MLVISRKPGESLILSNNIKITLLSINGDKVAIGIDAPPSVKIVRKELLETIEANIESTNYDNKHHSSIASLLKSNRISKNI